MSKHKCVYYSDDCKICPPTTPTDNTDLLEMLWKVKQGEISVNDGIKAIITKFNLYAPPTTDTTEWLYGLLSAYFSAGQEKQCKRASKAIQAHIDTVCREAIKEAVDYYAWRFECNTAVSEMYGWKGTLETAKEQTLRRFEATQLNPNKDTKPVAPEKWQDTPNVPVEIEGYRTKPVDELDKSVIELAIIHHWKLEEMEAVQALISNQVASAVKEAELKALVDFQRHWYLRANGELEPKPDPMEDWLGYDLYERIATLNGVTKDE